MSQILIKATNNLRNLLNDAVNKACENGELCSGQDLDFAVEIPADRSHGDFATNIAMVSAKVFRLPPKKIAEIIISNLNLENTMFKKVEVAGPGFINFFLSNLFYISVLRDIENLGSNYGRSNFGKGKKVMVEFVSANPTGPMHMGNARGGAIGDCLSAVLDAAGYDVYKEFYINDAGNQIEKFALSLDIRYQQIYKGEEK